MPSRFTEIPDCVSIRNDRIVLRKAYEEIHFAKARTLKQRQNEENLKENSPAGHINRKIRLKMNRIICNWISSVNTYNNEANPTQKRKFTFITLTLPATQKHTDKELHKKALGRYIQKLQRNSKMEHYLWRAERQKNGNLHYHIIIDSFIKWENIRAYWNEIMKDLSYIEDYQKNQQIYHRSGFQLNKEILSKRNEEKQRKAYQKGVSENWSNPNTTDIHSLKNIKDAARYIAKYTTKSDAVDSLQSLKEALKTEQIGSAEYDYYAEPILQEIEASKINARVWGCSDKLKELKDPKIIECAEVYLLLNRLQKDKDTKEIVKDNAVIFYNKNLQTIIKRYAFISHYLSTHYLNSYSHLYNVPLYNAKPQRQQEIIWQKASPSQQTTTYKQTSLFNL